MQLSAQSRARPGELETRDIDDFVLAVKVEPGTVEPGGRASCRGRARTECSAYHDSGRGPGVSMSDTIFSVVHPSPS